VNGFVTYWCMSYFVIGEMWGFDISVAEDSGLLRCDIVCGSWHVEGMSGTKFLNFWPLKMNVLHSFKTPETLTQQHSTMSQKVWILIL